eukprot:GHVT01084547.1.p1 GENE.GHVT01084547.1~~GHVT01084547.1.p1  ORF type:complete len:427 (+),score=34.30 GHVT01084547.1:54-1334(+)
MCAMLQNSRYQLSLGPPRCHLTIMRWTLRGLIPPSLPRSEPPNRRGAGKFRGLAVVLLLLIVTDTRRSARSLPPHPGVQIDRGIFALLMHLPYSGPAWLGFFASSVAVSGPFVSQAYRVRGSRAPNTVQVPAELRGSAGSIARCPTSPSILVPLAPRTLTPLSLVSSPSSGWSSSSPLRCFASTAHAALRLPKELSAADAAPRQVRIEAVDGKDAAVDSSLRSYNYRQCTLMGPRSVVFSPRTAPAGVHYFRRRTSCTRRSANSIWESPVSFLTAGAPSGEFFRLCPSLTPTRAGRDRSRFIVSPPPLVHPGRYPPYRLGGVLQLQRDVLCGPEHVDDPQTSDVCVSLCGLVLIFGRLAEHAGLHSWGIAGHPRLEYRATASKFYLRAPWLALFHMKRFLLKTWNKETRRTLDCRNYSRNYVGFWL